MDKEEKEEEESEKYFLKMLKEEYGMEDEEARRFYRGQPRSKTSGRFMRRGDGRRNYTPYSYMMPEMYDEDAEYYRDMDRSEGRMYYSGDSGSAPTPNSGNGNYSGGRRGYGKHVSTMAQAPDTRWQKEITQKRKNFITEIAQRTNKQK